MLPTLPPTLPTTLPATQLATQLATKPAAASRQRPLQRGTSLVESLLVLVIVAITLGAALPSFAGLQDRQRLRGVAAQLQTELSHARSLAVARNQVLRLSFGDPQGAGCWVLHTGATAAGCSCNASGAATCQPGVQALRTDALVAAHGVRLRPNVGAVAFEPHRGTVTPTATLRLEAPDAGRVNLVINIMGRVRACSPAATAGWNPC